MPGFSKVAMGSIDSWLPAPLDLRDSGANLSAQIIDDYHVKRTAEVICEYAKGNILHVALQFPDDMLQYGPFICEALRLFSEACEADHEDHPTINFFLLGDTSYGECCVDEVASQHLACDVIVHYGSACLSPTRTLPVLYVFPRIALENPEVACTRFKESIKELVNQTEAQRIVILYDLDLESCFTNDGFQAGEHQVSLASLDVGVDIQIAALRIPNAHAVRGPGLIDMSNDSKMIVGPHVVNLANIPAEKTSFVWYTRCVDEDEYPPLLRNAAIQLCSGASNASRTFFSVTLSGERSESVQLIEPSRILRKRFAAVSKIQEAERIGIIPGTLGVSGNTDIIERCKKLVSLAEKRSYVILVGKPNPVKLANYPEIDVFVLVACPQNGMLDDKEYLRPIVTPFELEAAVLRDGDIFSTNYTMDFQELLREKLCSPCRSEEKGKELISRSNDWSLAVSDGSGGADYLKKRHWQGLKYGEGGSDDNTDVEQLSTHIESGDSGIASGYHRELNLSPKGDH